MSKSILSVNVNKAMNYLLQTVFEKDYRIIPVTNCMQAIPHLKSNKDIQLVIIDVDVNPSQNWEFIQHIKTSRLYNLAVVVLANENNETVSKKCFELNIDEVFFKPFNPLDLVEAANAATGAYSNTN